MNLKEVCDGIAIFRKYFDTPDGYHIGADHDVIYIYNTDRPMELADIQAVIDLGWFQSDSELLNEDEEAGGEMAAKHYDPDESWWAFV